MLWSSRWKSRMYIRHRKMMIATNSDAYSWCYWIFKKEGRNWIVIHVWQGFSKRALFVALHLWWELNATVLLWRLRFKLGFFQCMENCCENGTNREVSEIHFYETMLQLFPQCSRRHKVIKSIISIHERFCQFRFGFVRILIFIVLAFALIIRFSNSELELKVLDVSRIKDNGFSSFDLQSW